MKIALTLLAAVVLGTTARNCGNKSAEDKVYKARLEIQGICMNYTFSMLEGTTDTSLVTPEWTDETTGKKYTNAFGLANPCDFPKTIKVGDEFYFRLDTTRKEDCIVCMAYYPTPPKKIGIKVMEEK